MSNSNDFPVIDYSMLKAHVFFPLSGVGTFALQTTLYPLVLLRTRLQLQEGAQVYKGLTHAVSSIVREEGIRGLYSGYFVKSVQIVSGMLYATTYESVRYGATKFSALSPSMCSFFGGAAASTVAQTLVVPIDVVSQHLMMLSRPTTTAESVTVGRRVMRKSPDVVGQPPRTFSYISQIREMTPIQLSGKEMSSSWSRFRAVISYVFKRQGVRGFYRGYLISLGTFVPNSALWWSFYDRFCQIILSFTMYAFPNWCSEHGLCNSDSANGLNDSNQRLSQSDHDHLHQQDQQNCLSSPCAIDYGFHRLPIQLIAGPSAGVAAATLVNPIDCVRVRMQIKHMPFRDAVHNLWRTEGFRWFYKGLSARLLQTGIFSFWLVLTYEPMKVLCLKDEFRRNLPR